MANYFEGLQFNIIYSSRKSIAIELRMDGILVRVPKGMSCGEINAFIHEKRSWIEKQLVKMQDRKKDLEQIPLFTRDEIREEGVGCNSRKSKEICSTCGCHLWQNYNS